MVKFEVWVFPQDGMVEWRVWMVDALVLGQARRTPPTINALGGSWDPL